MLKKYVICKLIVKTRCFDVCLFANEILCTFALSFSKKTNSLIISTMKSPHLSASDTIVYMESQTTEYKQQWNDKFLAYISGFAHAQGGNNNFNYM